MKNHESRHNELKDKTASSQEGSMLLGRLAVLGNFIKPMQDIIFHGAQPEAPAFEKSEKSWRDHNYCKWHWPGAAWLISWSPICILWWTVHSRPWNHIHNLEIIHKKRNYNGCHIMLSGIVAFLKVRI
jgi:hypothetical protein